MKVPDITTRQVRLEGLLPIMFDRYAGDNKTQLPPEEKMYFLKDGKTLCIPSVNISSFLSGKNTTSVAKLIGGRQQTALSNALLGFVIISPDRIPLIRDGGPIIFNGFVDGRDEKADIEVQYHVARLPKGIPNPKERPVVSLPWALEFEIKLFKNPTVDDTLLRRAFEQGGIALGLGTYRGVYGKFTVVKWK